MCPIVTLTSDFGPADSYVGAMHGVILGICPTAQIVDLCHSISPQNVRQAAFVLYTTYRFFPPGTVHVVVVDPGVGSERRIIALRTRDAYFVAPDNGVLSYILARETVLEQIHLTRREFWLPTISQTFHGRDIMAPVAAHLARGVPLCDLGEPVGDLVKFALSEPEVQPDGSIVGHILHIDRFGNLISDVREESLPNRQALVIYCAGRRIEGIHTTYASVADGQLVALIGSSGHLEIAVRNGNAAKLLYAQAGDEITIGRSQGRVVD